MKALFLLVFLLPASTFLNPPAIRASDVYARTTGMPWTGGIGVVRTVQELMMENDLHGGKFEQPGLRVVKIRPDRRGLPQNPSAPAVSQWPVEQSGAPILPQVSPQTVGVSFTGATLSGTNPTNSFPPDCMGAVGPTQYIVAVNGRIASFNKSTGVADGVLNADIDVFFNSVRNSSGTSDPRIRYDRLTQRWFIIIINVSTPNRILIAVSDAASAGVISGATVFTFFFIPIDTVPPGISNTCLADYPTLGLDANALYIGTNNFCGSPSQTFNSTDGYVVRKSSILGAGPMVVTVFRGLVASSTGAGPYTPQGVDNADPAANEGYFIGVDNATFSKLMLRRVSTPGATPTISGDIAITVPTTNFPTSVNHLGNTGGTSGRLDAIDDRLFAAHIRNGRLWTAHNIQVNASGVASSSGGRNGTRWYELRDFATGGTPALVQSGTVFDNAATNPTSYWIPSIMVSGQGHAALGFSNAGANSRINAATVGRLSGDALGTMQTPLLLTSSSTAYNPPADPGGPRRWGDYSYTSLDPNDDMTMWTVQQFCDATNSYGVRVAELKAPPPVTPASANPPEVAPLAAVDVTISGTSVAGSGFFDPGAGFSKRLSASFSGGTGTIVVNSFTVNSPTSVTLNLNTGGASGNFIVTITNPDGQAASSVSAMLGVNPALPVQLASFSGMVSGNSVRLEWRTVSEINNYGFEVQRSIDRSGEFLTLPNSFVAGHGTTSIPRTYTFTDPVLAAPAVFYRLKQIDLDGSVHYIDPIQVGSPTAVNPGEAELVNFKLHQNYPNPFNPVTTIRFTVDKTGHAVVRVVNPLGQTVADLFDAVAETGRAYDVEFDGSRLPSGVYFYQLQSGGKTSVKKLVLAK